MSNKQINKNLNSSQPTKVIEVGKFYLIHDGSKTGHPGYVIRKDDGNNCYLVVRTESDKKGAITKRDLQRQHLIDLTHPTDSNVVKSYIRSRPLMCKRKDIGSKELVGMSFHNDDMDKVTTVANKEPEYTKSFKKKQPMNPQ